VSERDSIRTWNGKHILAGELRAVAGILRRWDAASTFAPMLEERAVELDAWGEDQLKSERDRATDR